MIVVAIIGLLASVAVPNFVTARNQARKNACLNNLRLIFSAKEQFAIESGAAETYDVLDADITPYFRGGLIPTCPALGTYTNGKINEKPTCDQSVLLGHILP